MTPRRLIGILPAAALLAGVIPAAASGPCENTVSFDAWLSAFRRDAVAAGISRKTVDIALGGLTEDAKTLARDRRQDFFWQDFPEFSAKLATPYRVTTGRKKIARNRELFDRVESEYGVPPPVIAAFWALETDFGAVTGKTPVLRSLATLAWDCRRGDLFRGELLAALRLIDGGDLDLSEMIGSWAGELGQTQFLPTHYLEHAVDFDGDGRRDLIRSTPDALASTAACIRSFGWRPGQPWLEEVRAPAAMAWEEADLSIVHPRRFWIDAGVRRADGSPLAEEGSPGSLILPVGRHGPAFLAGPNFRVFLEWNRSLNYALTAAYLATRLDGAPAMRAGNARVESLGYEQVRELQRRLKARGYAVEKIDGKLGENSRAAVRAAQLDFGLPADAWPTAELLGRLASDRDR